jgi:AAA domain-containing protein
VIIIVIGRPQQGKSTLAKFIADQSPTRVVIDPRRQFNTSETFYNVSDPNANLYAALDVNHEVIVRPGLEGEGAIEPVAQEFLDWTEDNPEEKVCLLIDEANMLGMDSKPQETFPHLNYILRSANQKNIDIIFTSHRIVELHPAYRAMANFVFVFRTTHSPDLKALEEKCGEEFTEKAKTLAPREVLVWNDDTATFRLETDSSKWFVDLTKIKEDRNTHASSISRL